MLLSLGVRLEDFAVVVLALVAGGADVLLELILGSAAFAASGAGSSRAATGPRWAWNGSGRCPLRCTGRLPALKMLGAAPQLHRHA